MSSICLFSWPRVKPPSSPYWLLVTESEFCRANSWNFSPFFARALRSRALFSAAATASVVFPFGRDQDLAQEDHFLPHEFVLVLFVVLLEFGPGNVDAPADLLTNRPLSQKSVANFASCNPQMAGPVCSRTHCWNLSGSAMLLLVCSSARYLLTSCSTLMLSSFPFWISSSWSIRSRRMSFSFSATLALSSAALDTSLLKLGFELFAAPLNFAAGDDIPVNFRDNLFHDANFGRNGGCAHRQRHKDAAKLHMASILLQR